MLNSYFSNSSRCLMLQVHTFATKAIKHKPPQKLASTLLSQLRTQEFEKLRNGREWPRILAGDSIQIDKLPFVTSTTMETVKGVVIAKTNRSSDTAVTIVNNEHGTPVIRRLVLYCPLIKNVTILQRAFIRKGLKRVRKSKIYYYLKKDPELYTIK